MADNSIAIEPIEGDGEGDGNPEPQDYARRAYLTWKDLKLTVDGKRYILQGLSGYAEPGRLLAIMGPSGSGKSTLLDTLAGRQMRDATVTGDILVNGHKTNLSYGTAAYLAQEVALLGTLTVYETLYYSAKLRFKDSTSESETKRLVMTAIEDVGLVDSRNTPIGNWYRRGVSGGERRRVSIAVELLISPSLIFLDEPTTGLDSASSFHVIKTLKALAEGGDRTILCSIHQPSSEVYELFDDLCLLTDGQQIYHGQLPGALKFFEENGYPCPPMRSASDHYLHCVNSDFDTVARTLGKQQSVTNSGRRLSPLASPLKKSRKSAKQAVLELTQAYKTSSEMKLVEARIGIISRKDAGHFEDKGSHASFFKQSYYLTIRSFKNMNRDIGYYWLRAVVYIALSVCLGTIFGNIGHSYNSISARASALTFIVSFFTFMAIGGFPSFIEDMKVFSTERLNGHCRVSSFVVGNTLSSLPFLLLLAALGTTVIYPLIKLHGGFITILYFLLNLYACLLVTEAMMMAVSSLVSQFLLGIIVAAGVQAIYILVSGFFRLPNDLPNPVWKYPLFYMSYLTYGFQGLMQNEMQGKVFDPMYPDEPPVTGHYALEVLYQIDMNRSKWWNLTIVSCLVIGYRIIFFTLLVCRESIFPTVASLISKKWADLRVNLSKLFTMISKTSPSDSPARQPAQSEQIVSLYPEPLTIELYPEPLAIER